MHSAAITSHMALTGSPRLSATIPRATAPSTATATHSNFFEIDIVRSYGFCTRLGGQSLCRWRGSLGSLVLTVFGKEGTLARKFTARHTGNSKWLRGLPWLPE